MFVYGVAYAVASIGCTIGLFASMAFGAPDSFVAGVANVVAYGAGMALVVTALTVSLAVANHALLRVLRSAMRYANQLAAAFVLLSGAYLLYYFWVVDVNEESDAITERRRGLPERRARAAERQLAAAPAAGAGAAVGRRGRCVLRRRRRDGERRPPGPSVASPRRVNRTLR